MKLNATLQSRMDWLNASEKALKKSAKREKDIKKTIKKLKKVPRMRKQYWA